MPDQAGREWVGNLGMLWLPQRMRRLLGMLPWALVVILIFVLAFVYARQRWSVNGSTYLTNMIVSILVDDSFHQEAKEALVRFVRTERHPNPTTLSGALAAGFRYNAWMHWKESRILNAETLWQINRIHHGTA